MIIELRSLGDFFLSDKQVQISRVLAWKMNYFAVSSSNSYFSMNKRQKYEE